MRHLALCMWHALASLTRSVAICSLRISQQHVLGAGLQHNALRVREAHEDDALLRDGVFAAAIAPYFQVGVRKYNL